METSDLKFVGNNPGASQHGNFINYYGFNTENERISAFPTTGNIWSDDGETDNKYFVLDIGCNSGVLTNSLHEHIRSQLPNCEIYTLGIDLDPALIERANSANNNPNITFKCVNMMNDEDCAQVEEYLKNNKISKFNAVCCFSITMWIHLNHGDKGLNDFLRKAANLTKSVLIIEPQPWKCYKQARDRLRKAGYHNTFPEHQNILISKEKLLPHIKDFMKTLGLDAIFTSEKTKWKREITFYKYPVSRQ